MNLERLAQALLCFAAFLLPITGGQLMTDGTALAPGTPWLGLFLGSVDAPAMGYVLPGVLVALSLALALGTRRVTQLPFPPFTFAVATLVTFALFAIIPSEHDFASASGAVVLLAQLVFPFAATAALGRVRGPLTALASLVAGCAVVAGMGVMEYVGMRATDPSWRIFATWVNPNALAGMLVIGLVGALGLAGLTDRVARIAAGAAAILIGLALLLTQSKGGYLAAAIGVGALAALMLLWGGSRRWSLLGLVAGICVVVGLVGFGVQRASQSMAGPATGGLARVSQAGDTQEQSAGFRQLLWRSALDVMRQRPFGVGLQSFRHEVSRAGLVPNTVTAHQGYLQLGVEIGIGGLAAFLAVLLIWGREMLRGRTEAGSLRAVGKATLFAAVLASLAHNLVDSDLQHFGTGAALLLLLGIGLQWAADAITPEPLPRPLRAAGVATLALVAGGIMYVASVDTLKANARGALAMGRAAEFRDLVDRLEEIAGNDPEVWALAGSAAPSAQDRLEALRRSADLGPRLRTLRALAYTADSLGQELVARDAIRRALDLDPNNLLALRFLLQLESKIGSREAAIQVAQRMIAIESKPYFRIRALPEIVPTETFEARLYLASLEKSPGDVPALLEPAIEGYVAYAQRTAPLVVMHTRAGSPQGYAGVTVDDALAAVALGRQTLTLLGLCYRTMGVPEADPRRERLRASRAAFDAVEADLRSLSR